MIELLGRVRDLERQVAARDAEIARLKGLKGRPDIRPSGMEQSSKSPPDPPAGPRRGGGNKTSRRTIHEDRVVKADVPPGSRFKGYQTFVVQDLILRPHVLRLRRECGVTPDGQRITAALPAGISGHFGPELRRFVLGQYPIRWNHLIGFLALESMTSRARHRSARTDRALAQHHQGQVTVGRLLTLLRDIGIDISKRQLMRLLIAGQDGFVAEARDVLRAGLETARWISVDDTGARHKAANGVRTQIGNQDFTWFGTTASKSRLNFLGLARAPAMPITSSTTRHSTTCAPAAWPSPCSTAWAAMRHSTSLIRRAGPRIWNGSASRAWGAASRRRASPPKAHCGAVSQPMACCAKLSSSATMPASSMSAATRCAGCMPSAWCTGSTPSPMSSARHSSSFAG